MVPVRAANLSAISGGKRGVFPGGYNASAEGDHTPGLTRDGSGVLRRQTVLRTV